MIPDKNLLKRLDLEHLSEEIGRAFCNHMNHQHRCFKMTAGSCRSCEDALTFFTTHDMENANNRDALILWRLNNYAKGKLNIYRNNPKKSIKRYHEHINPIKDANAIMKGIFG